MNRINSSKVFIQPKPAPFSFYVKQGSSYLSKSRKSFPTSLSPSILKLSQASLARNRLEVRAFDANQKVVITMLDAAPSLLTIVGAIYLTISRIQNNREIEEMRKGNKK